MRSTKGTILTSSPRPSGSAPAQAARTSASSRRPQACRTWTAAGSGQWAVAATTRLVDAARPLAAAEHEQGAAAGVEAEGGHRLVVEGGPVEVGQLGADRVADHGGALGREGLGGRVHPDPDPAGHPGGQAVGDPGHGVLLVQDDRHALHPGGQRHRQGDVAAHAADHVEAVLAQQPPGREGAADGRERGLEGLGGQPARQGQDGQQVEGEAGLGHRPGLDAPGRAGEADGRLRVVLDDRAGQGQPGEHVPAGPPGGDQQRQPRPVLRRRQPARPRGRRGCPGVRSESSGFGFLGVRAAACSGVLGVGFGGRSSGFVPRGAGRGAAGSGGPVRRRPWPSGPGSGGGRRRGWW